MPLNLTLAPRSVVSSLPSVPKPEDVAVVPSVKLVPKIAATEPGVSGVVPGTKLALLTTPLLLTEGGGSPVVTVAVMVALAGLGLVTIRMPM